MIKACSNDARSAADAASSWKLDLAHQAHCNSVRCVRHQRHQRFGLLARTTIEGPRIDSGTRAPDLDILRRQLLQTGPGLRPRPHGEQQGKGGKKVRRSAIGLTYCAGM